MKKIMLAFMLCVLMITSVFAGSADIGDGTSTSYLMPADGYYNNNWSHFILPGDAITSVIDITKLEFDVSNTPPSYVMNNQTVYMKLTTATTVGTAYTATPATAGYTQVYSGSVTWNGSGWQGIALASPFVYDGTSNLEIIWENRAGNNAGWGNYALFNTTSATTAGAYSHSDSGFPEESGYNYQLDYYPNTRVTWAEEGEPIAPTLVSPANLATGVATDVELTWTNGDNTDHTVLYLADNVSLTGATRVDPAASPYVTDLETGTTYYWKVVAVSENNLEATSAVRSFSTALAEGTYVLELVDSFGDGWNGNTIDLLVDGLVIYDDIAIDSGASESFVFSAEPGQTITTLFDGSGSYPSENSFDLYDYQGNLLASGDQYTDINYYIPLPGSPDVPTLTSPLNGATNVALVSDLEWTTGANTNHSVLYISEIADFAGATPINSATSPYLPTLNGATTYYWKVVAVSTGGIERPSEVRSFTTIYPTVTDFPWIEGFEDWTTTSAPASWAQISVSGLSPWESTTSSHSGAKAARGPWASEGGEHLLITPTFDLDAGTDYRLKFWLKGGATWDETSLTVQIAGDYTDATSFTEELAYYVGDDNMPADWTEQTIPLTEYSGNQVIAFRLIDDNGLSCYIDDVIIEEIPTGTLIQITPDVKDFGNVHLGYEATQTFTIANNGVIEASIGEITVPNGYSMETAVATFPHPLPMGESFTVDVTFAPSLVLSYSGNLRVKELDGFTPVMHNAALTGSGIPVPQGANCSNPIELNFPAVDITGNTGDFIDDYENAWVTPSTSYLGGDDVVYQFELTSGKLLNGTITTTINWIGAYILEEEPNASTPAPIILQKTSSGQTLTYTDEFIPAGTYFLIISSNTAPQSIDYTINLTADALPIPGIATNPSPANEAVDQPSIVNLSWNNASYTETIDLWFGIAGARDMALVLDDVAAVTTHQVTGLIPNETYNWKVVNRNYNGETPEVDVVTWSFTTIGNPPEAVTNPTPADAAIDRPLFGNLTWNTATGADGYKVYLGTDDQFTGVTLVDQPGTSFAYSGLDYSTTYYWKVIPYNAVGDQTVGILTWSFTTIEDPSIPMPVIVNFDGSTSRPAEITAYNMGVSSTHGNNSNGLYKNLWGTGSSQNGYAQFQVMKNVQADSELNFEYRIMAYSGYPGAAHTIVADEYIKINISNDGGGNYTTLTEINSVNHVVSTDFVNVSVPLGAYAGDQIIVRLEAHRAAGDYYVDFDNFYFRVPPTEPIVTVSDTEIDFGVGNIFETDSEVITISNMGGGTLNISTIEVVGTDAVDFNATTETGASQALAFGEILAITVEFTPLTVGLKEATLQITDDQGRIFRINTNSKTNNSNRSINEVALSGECVDPSLSMPVIVNFDGSTSRPAEITAYNMLISSSHGNNSNGMYKNIYGTGTSQDGYAQFQVMKNVEADTELNFEYRIMKYSGYPNTAHEIVADDYIRITASNDCGATFTTLTEINSVNHVVSTDFVNVSVPLGTYAGDQIIVRLEAHRADGDYYVDFDNFYFRVPPTAAVTELSITEHDFATVILSTTSAAKTVTVTNVGVGILNINEIALTGANANDFAFEVDAEAPMALANGESLDIAVTFTPTVGGVRSATLVITDDLGNRRNANVVTLTGNGYDATITSLPYTEGFEENNVHDSQPIGWSQVSEAGTQAWVVNKTNTSYNQAPRTGEYNATLRYGNTDWLIRPINVIGGQAYDVELYARQDGTTSSDASVGIYFNSEATIATMTSIAEIGLGNEYQLIAGSFIPDTDGIYYIGIKGEINFGPWRISIDDITVKDGPTTPVIGVSATELDYGTVTVGASDTKPLTISNAGVGSLNITAIEIEGDNAADFTLVMEETLPVTLTAGLSLPIEVKFAPLANGLREATLTITDNLGRTFRLNSATRPANNGRADNLVTLTGDGYVAPQGSVCSNPLPLVFPAIDVTGDTGDYGNDYDSGWITGGVANTSYLNGDDVVYQFTVATDVLLNGTIEADGTWMGVFILQDEPSTATPAQVIHSIGASSGYSVTYTDVAIPAGTYYMIISTWPTPNNVEYTINLTATADLDAPTNVAIATTANGTNLTWDVVTGATSYIVWGCDTPDGEYVELGRTADLYYLSYIEDGEMMKFFKIEASAEPAGNPAKGFGRRN